MKKYLPIATTDALVALTLVLGTIKVNRIPPLQNTRKISEVNMVQVIYDDEPLSSLSIYTIVSYGFGNVNYNCSYEIDL